MHRLPAELRTLPAAKAELAAMVFEESRREVGPDDAYRIVRVLAEYHEPGLVASQPGRQNRFSDVLAELRLLHEGLKRFDAAAFQLRFQTGLEQPLEPADVDLEPAERTRQLIARLQDDEELGGLARIARHMMAAIHLPRAISDREDLPVGGVSDISNRGPLDRLLLSELAHDDLTLAVRIAMNEALYLRRETPPSNPPKHRAVLLDSGVRLWGVPRVFATAVGMALAAGAQRNVRTDVFRAAGDGVVRRVAGGPGGRGCAHGDAGARRPSRPSLAAFAATASAEAGLLDAVIVTGEDVAADHDFQRSLAALELPSVLLATVSREGRFRLVSQGRRGSKLLREATLDLDKLLARPVRRQAPLIDPARARRPAGDPLGPAVSAVAFLSAVRSCAGLEGPVGRRPLDLQGPLPVPLASAGPRRAAAERSYSRRGVALDRPGRSRAPSAWRLSACCSRKGSGCCASIRRRTNASLSRSICRTAVPMAVCGHAGTVFVIYPDRVDVFESARGSRIESTPIPERPVLAAGPFLQQFHAMVCPVVRRIQAGVRTAVVQGLAAAGREGLGLCRRARRRRAGRHPGRRQSLPPRRCAENAGESRARLAPCAWRPSRAGTTPL